MTGSRENLRQILEYRKIKIEQLKRPISYSEAIALWISECLSFSGVQGENKTFVVTKGKQFY